ncbi:MAG: sulfatase-like hydrolase/transferase [Tepidisphaeraceae bacterium]
MRIHPTFAAMAMCLAALVGFSPLSSAADRADSTGAGRAQQAASASDRTVLPPAPPKFQGRIDVALKDSTSEWPEPVKAPKGAPNVLLIMGDDIGYAHMSAFGGPASTPTFDRLAKNGLAFTNFHTTAVCSASRAALLTGRNSHSVGMGSTPEGSLPYPGYHATIQRNAATVLETLRLNDKLRERILARQLELGIVPPGTKLAPMPKAIPAWDTLSEIDKKVGARWMEVFTGAVEHTDYQIGRIVSAIEQSGDFDNTLIIYIAGDNGPTPEGGLHGINNKLTYANGVKESLEDVAKHMDDFGGTHSHGCNPAAWSYATSTPYTYGKLVVSGGGNSTAMAISWPARIKPPHTPGGGNRHQFTHLIDVVPTILECAGLPEPKRVNGVEQKPLEGVSMVYAFDDANAKERHTTQYFELTGSRAIYHDGWWAGTRHGMDGVSPPSKEPIPFDKDVWELYDTRTDFGHATDLAARNPEKLKELQALFDKEARKYNVYPMVDSIFQLLAIERPSLVEGNKAVYGAGTVRLVEEAAIDIKNRSFTITAEAENPDGKAEGMLVTEGGETGGYAFMVKDGKPTFIYSYIGLEHFTITASEPLPKGKCMIVFDFKYDGGGKGKGGVGTLSINGKEVGEGRIEKTVPTMFSTDDTFDVGEDWGTPVSPDYKLPAKFTGALRNVTVEVK